MPDGQTRLWLEAESSQLVAPMRFATDTSASLGAYVEVPQGSGNNVGSATLPVSVPTSGTYYLWVRVRAASTADDSYTISLNGKSLTWNAGVASNWTWRRVDSVSGFVRQPVAFYLSKGRATLRIGAREDGVQVDRVLITTDAYTNPATIEPTASPTNVVVEAESGAHNAPWGVEIDGTASAGAYLMAPTGQQNYWSPDDAPQATVQFNVAASGYYAIWARVLAPDTYTNSFFVKVDNDDWWTWHISLSTAWQTRRVYNHDGSSNQPVTVWLNAGAHTLTLGQRESGTGIDTIIVTNQFGTTAPATTTAPAPDDCQYRYDAQGNVLTVASNENPTRNYEYDLHGRVTSLVSGAAIGKYRYGPEGEVMSYVQGGTGSENRSESHYGPFTRSYFTKDGQSVSLIERRIPGVPIIRRGTGPDATVLYGHYEGTNLRRVTDQTGKITQEITYRAYGGIVENTGLPGGVGSLLDGFGNSDHLDAFGVVRMGARIYDPRTGRFLQRDPLIISRTTTMMNPYGFAWNDPINYADPSGMDPGPRTDCGGPGACGQGGVISGSPIALGAAAAAAAASEVARRQQPHVPSVEELARAQFDRAEMANPMAPTVFAYDGAAPEMKEYDGHWFGQADGVYYYQDSIIAPMDELSRDVWLARQQGAIRYGRLGPEARRKARALAQGVSIVGDICAWGALGGALGPVLGDAVAGGYLAAQTFAGTHVGATIFTGSLAGGITGQLFPGAGGLVEEAGPPSAVVLSGGRRARGLLVNARQKAIDVLRPANRLIGQAGSSKRIRILEGGQDAARALYRQLVRETGATPITKPGVTSFFRIPGGGGSVGFRSISGSGLPTLDVRIPGLRIREIKFLLP